MKHKIVLIFFAAIVSFTSTGFGFLESSTAFHRTTNQSTKSDSVSMNALNISFRNAVIPQKKNQKPENDYITESIIQWVANVLKNTIEKVMSFVKAILMVV